MCTYSSETKKQTSTQWIALCGRRSVGTVAEERQVGWILFGADPLDVSRRKAEEERPKPAHAAMYVKYSIILPCRTSFTARHNQTVDGNRQVTRKDEKGWSGELNGLFAVPVTFAAQNYSLRKTLEFNTLPNTLRWVSAAPPPTQPH